MAIYGTYAHRLMESSDIIYEQTVLTEMHISKKRS